MDTEKTTRKRPASRWREHVWMLLALLLVITGTVMFGINYLARAVRFQGITGEIMPELAAVDHIEAAAGDLSGFNVVFITTDTTRADHIGCYGNQSVRTPVIDGLAREGILFSQAITPSPSTLPAHSSLLTGLYPANHGVRANGTFRLDEKMTTLAERLKGKGYRTGAAVSAFVLDGRFGLDQGFDLYHDDLTKGMKYSAHMFRERAAELTNEPVVSWLQENADQPFFFWVHYFDPHAVYMPPEPFRTQYAGDLYDGEIAYVDSQIGVLLAELERLGVREKTLIIYTSDHGEGLGEHSELTHSMLVYDSTLHVPMVFHAPAKLPQGKVIHRQACLVDVVPTVLSLLGEEVPDDLDGVNLCEVPTEEFRPVLIETIATMTTHGWAPLVGVRRVDYKYILAPTPELYDLQADPRELTNIHDDQQDMVRDLSTRLVSWLGEDPYLAARKAVDFSNVELDDESIRNLAALGYISTTSGSDDNLSPRLADPKDMIHHWESIQEAIHLRAKGDPKAAIPILEQAVAEVPGDVFARSILGSIYYQMGDNERAIVHYKRVIEDDPRSESARLGLGAVYYRQRKYDEAQKMIDEVLDISPENAQAYILQGKLAVAGGQPQKAIELYEQAIEMDPGSTGPEAYNQIGFLRLNAGQLDEARDAFENAIRIDALNGNAHAGLADILNQEADVEGAIAELQVALRFDPNQPRALVMLAFLLSNKEEPEKAMALCQRAIDIYPKFDLAQNIIGLIHRRRGELDLAEEHYLKAIEIKPRMDAAHVNLGQLYNRQGRTEEALEQFRLAIQSNPRRPSPVALCNLGAYRFNTGKPRDALQYYLRALRVDPDYALVHKQIASIYTLPDWDRPDLTAYHMRRTLELDPNQPDAPQLRELLDRAEKETARRRTRSGDQEPTDERLPNTDAQDTSATTEPPTANRVQQQSPDPSD